MMSGRVPGLSPTYEQAHAGLDLLTLVSYNTGRRNSVKNMIFSHARFVLRTNLRCAKKQRKNGDVMTKNSWQ